MEDFSNIKACVQYSGGLMSFGAAKIVCDEYGPENVVLLFADTGSESDGTYRFMWQGAQVLGAKLVCVRNKMNGQKYVKPWDIAIAHNWIPNWRAGLCTLELKKQPLMKWVKENIPSDADIVIGFGVEEMERIERLKAKQPKIKWRFPLAEKPYTPLCQIRTWIKDYNIDEPDLYEQGFNHANCNGACFKSGMGHWARLYKERPEVFAYHEQKEKEWQEITGRDSTICIRKGEHLPLSELRKLVDEGVVKPSYFRLPCACGVVFYDENEEKPLMEDE